MLAAKVERYRTQDRETIERLQVAQFNAVRSYCLSDVPFYRAWAREHNLPDRIDASIGRRISRPFQPSRSGASWSAPTSSSGPARW
jgi:hypothetical protein